MNKLAIDLLEYVKDGADQNQEIKDLYKSLMYALEDMEYLQTLPKKFQDPKVIEDAWDIARCREMALSPDSFIEDLLPTSLADVIGVDAGSYFRNLVSYEIECHIDSIFNEIDIEEVRSDAIDKVIDELCNGKWI